VIKTGSEGSLKKELGTLEVFCIASGAMISSGLFVLPALAYGKAGPGIILAYLLAAVIVIPAMFAKAELATAMPKAGGAYFFVNRSFGPLFGTFAGIAAWLSLALKSAFALVGIGVFISSFLGGAGTTVKVVALGCIFLFTLLNILSVRTTGRFQVVFVLTLLGILSWYIIDGMAHLDIQRYTPFLPNGWRGVFMTAGVIFVSFGGLTKVASVAEEIRNPGKTIPKGMFSAFFIVTLFYLLTVFVTVGVLDPGVFKTTLRPISEGAAGFAGTAGYYILAGAAMLAFMTTGNAGLMAASRTPLAMAKDNLLPNFFGRVNLRTKTPVLSILTTSLFMAACVLFLDLEHLVKVASTMKLLLFAFVNISVILMRESRIVTYKPVFTSPLYPWIQIAGTAIYILLIGTMGRTSLILTGIFFVFSAIWYFSYSKVRTRRESALIQVAENVSSRELKSANLRDELRDILIARDQIVEDRFDRMITQAKIFDIDASMKREELFRLLASHFAQTFSKKERDIYRLLEEREADSTTMIHPGLAIPHIVVKGEELFDITVVRSRQGILFEEGGTPVHIVFALAGSKDERPFHLQALMAIAQIVQNKEFITSWINARNTDELRTLILIADRVRKGSI